MFDYDFYRNLDYVWRQDITFGPNHYDLYNYTLDSSEFDVSSEYLVDIQGYINISTVLNSPIVVSYPYFLGCPADSFSSLAINNTNPLLYQGSILPGYYLVEKTTGITVNYTKNYQYNLYYKNPFAPGSPTYIVPLINIQETFSTPDSMIDNDLAVFYESVEAGYDVEIIGFILAGILAWVLICYSVAIRRKMMANPSARHSSRRNDGSEISSKIVYNNMIKEASEVEEDEEESYSRGSHSRI